MPTKVIVDIPGEAPYDVRIGSGVLARLGSHDTPGLHLQRVFDRNGKCQLLNFADSMFDIGTLQAGVCFCKCRIDLFLNIFCLIDQSHQFFQKNIPLLIHQIIALMRQCQRVFGKH